jgi:DNA repair exonuclease SbcCD ATPase subunit
VQRHTARRDYATEDDDGRAVDRERVRSRDTIVMSSSYVDHDNLVENEDEVRALANARIRNQATAASLASVWRRRCERMTTDLERAQETYEEMKREVFRGREERRIIEEEREELLREIETLRRERDANLNESRRRMVEIEAATARMESEDAKIRDLDETLREERGRWATEREKFEVERATGRERTERERARADAAEKRLVKMEKQVKSGREAMERMRIEHEGEIARERSIRERLEEDRVSLEADRRRFRDFDAQLGAERVKTVEAHAASKLAQDSLREQVLKAEKESMELRRMMEQRSTEMANAVRQLNEELAAQHDVVERGMSARVDALRDTMDEEIERVRANANARIKEAQSKVAAADERAARMERVAEHAEGVSRNALAKLKLINSSTTALERECEHLRANLHKVGALNAKLTRRIIDGEPFVLDDERVHAENEAARLANIEPNVATPSPPSERASKTRTLSPPARVVDIQSILSELEIELSQVRREHDSLAREMGETSADDGELLCAALEDARERLEAKSRQVKMLNAAVRNNT